METDVKLLMDKVRGLLEEQVEAVIELAGRDVDIVPLSSAWSLQGLMNHERFIVRFWIGNIIAGLDLPVPWTEDDPDADWRPHRSETLHSLVASLRDEIGDMEGVLAQRSSSSAVQMADDDGSRPSVAEILVHLVAEIARHSGHLDIVAELTSSQKALSPELP